MLQEKRISSKINYEVLKSLNVGSTPSKDPAPQIPDDISFVTPKKVDTKETTSTISTRYKFLLNCSILFNYFTYTLFINMFASFYNSTKKSQPKIIESARRTPNINIPASRKRKVSISDTEPVSEPVTENLEEPMPIADYDINNEFG